MVSTSLHYVRKTPLISAMKHVRRHFALFLSMTVLVMLIICSKKIGGLFESEQWEIGSLYAAVFSWSSLQGAFLFGIYAFVLSGSEGFVKAVKNTTTFKRGREFVRTTVYMTLALSAICLPLLVIHPSLPVTSSLTIGYCLFAFIAATSIYIFCRFLTVLKLFRILERSR